jgi:hypothetical protein
MLNIIAGFPRLGTSFLALVCCQSVPRNSFYLALFKIYIGFEVICI